MIVHKLIPRLLVLFLTVQLANAQQKSPLTRQYITPVRIVWKNGDVRNSEQLLKPGIGQGDLANRNIVILNNKKAGEKASILLDFGRELHGGLEIVTGMWGGGNKPRNIHIRYGESVSEAMSSIGEKGATNDHAIRDFRALVPWLGKIQFGESGFRFVRIDLEDEHAELQLKEIRAIYTFRDIPYLGSFKSSDERLNKIWQTGAYTVHLNMQEYLWDGIKRDRLVWVGDLHPEVSTLSAVFGYNEVVPKSLDLSRDTTPLPGWMNGISTYSMWWIIIHYDWYMKNGNLAYLKEQKTYLNGLVKQIVARVGNDNKEHMDGTRFLDWPSSENPKGIHAGLQAMTVWSLATAAKISVLVGDKETEALCNLTVTRMKKYIPDVNNSKQAAALMAIAGITTAEKANKEVLSVGGAKNFSTFYGYYMLETKAKAGDYQGAIDVIREYWGAMLDLGATTFWEDFNMDWLPNASRIDEPVPAGKIDIHGDYGAYCYVGFRHSLCHGWASGPTSWLTEHVLGIKVMAPGSKIIKITPHLGDLKFAEGTFPTPYGVVKVKHTKLANGKIHSEITGPKQVKIIR
ncbi:alpha-L-rhamnosidase C-terminal domain-containing protein [Pedobacter heparinus]|uniref:Alpha-L-rhamnosidase n=1 Tax=Pedobacter heparinus (strain ATCC 13125 / DSM 2366 / CIP 104194 / JCM 7457 / NBRC 12017 / NCIMB 9290 / NRRL B-14731 / HIM 762-3) TaxID=485917 RepID=C6XYM5_PEDHD|nr:alpha-L-rhamnosidase C-terminal domain-containing protein [Pedobacter heparinus]ACU04507.1 alpha-L-rhamnosidase [Pedobacter heparinus DSM 2366]